MSDGPISSAQFESSRLQFRQFYAAFEDHFGTLESCQVLFYKLNNAQSAPKPRGCQSSGVGELPEWNKASPFDRMDSGAVRAKFAFPKLLISLYLGCVQNQCRGLDAGQ